MRPKKTPGYTRFGLVSKCSNFYGVTPYTLRFVFTDYIIMIKINNKIYKRAIIK